MASIRMNALWLKKLQVPDKQTEYFDQVQKGLGLRIGPSGKKVFFVRYRIRGDNTYKWHRLSLEPYYPALSLADARALARETLHLADQGLDPAKQKQDEKKADTFQELADLYIQLHGSKKKVRP